MENSFIYFIFLDYQNYIKSRTTYDLQSSTLSSYTACFTNAVAFQKNGGLKVMLQFFAKLLLHHRTRCLIKWASLDSLISQWVSVAWTELQNGCTLHQLCYLFHLEQNFSVLKTAQQTGLEIRVTVLSHASSKSTFWYPAGDQRVAMSYYFNSIERYHAESPNQAKPCQSLTDSHGLHRKGWRESTVIRCWTTGCSHFSLPSSAIMSQETQGRQGFHAAVKRSLQTSREHPASIHPEA